MRWLGGTDTDSNPCKHGREEWQWISRAASYALRTPGGWGLAPSYNHIGNGDLFKCVDVALILSAKRFRSTKYYVKKSGMSA